MNITLPFPPYINKQYHHTSRGVFLTERVKQYRQDAGWRAKAQGVVVQEGALRVTLDFYRPRKRGDVDGPLKQCLDALNGIAWHDDGQIVELLVRRHEDKTNPRVEIQVAQAKEG